MYLLIPYEWWKCFGVFKSTLFWNALKRLNQSITLSNLSIHEYLSFCLFFSSIFSAISVVFVFSVKVFYFLVINIVLHILICNIKNGIVWICFLDSSLFINIWTDVYMPIRFNFLFFPVWKSFMSLLANCSGCTLLNMQKITDVNGKSCSWI